MDSISSGSMLFGAISVSTTMRGLRSAAKDVAIIASDSSPPTEHVANRGSIAFYFACRVGDWLVGRFVSLA